MIYVDAEGHQKHVKDENAKLVEREKRGVHVGKTMRCIAGTHAGLLCDVLALEPKVRGTPSSSDPAAGAVVSQLVVAEPDSPLQLLYSEPALLPREA